MLPSSSEFDRLDGSLVEQQQPSAPAAADSPAPPPPSTSSDQQQPQHEQSQQPSAADTTFVVTAREIPLDFPSFQLFVLNTDADDTAARFFSRF